ncbi:hypothetical protein, partial [Brevibacillus sp. 179-C 1.1 NHS]|uniref:hypothetical protein n=1 Tax=Brevibacillus sp. 179-C 1.1 NHS TaxID=3235177 RepID=UPI0039A2D6FF
FALFGCKNKLLAAHHQLFAKVGSPVLDTGIACLCGAASAFRTELTAIAPSSSGVEKYSLTESPICDMQ